MRDTIDYGSVAAMLRAAAGELLENRDQLSQLDSVTGDGDHGTAVAKVARAITETLGKDESGDLKKLLKDIGWAVLSTDAGSTSPLYGSLFVGMSEAAPAEGPVDCAVFAGMLESGIAKLRKNTRAEVGGKTMIDTLVPALDAVRAAAESRGCISEVMTAAAEAATRGAESTRDMQASFGRAKNIGERSIGHIDPGAASMAIFINGLNKGLKDNG